MEDKTKNGSVVVSYPAKVQIFQLITTDPTKHTQDLRCFLPCKGTNFSANHNACMTTFASPFVVSYPAKVQIFQLITTRTGVLFIKARCFLPCKGTNFSANHNSSQSGESMTYVVSYPAKVQIFQLITTAYSASTSQIQLFLTLQRYKFFS